MAEIMLPKEGNCSGCSACLNVCPANAIEMKPSSMGFIIPIIEETKCINCGLCTKTCPVLNPNYKNNKQPDFYSFCASDEIRKNSSSGGMFTTLANYVLRKNGYVCGAAFDENFQVKHRIIHSSEELSALQYSKYVQSSVGKCYKEVKKLLLDDNYVLFTGTPCQVAGLYAVLGKDFDKLITADLLCHGVPSQKLFDKYLKDISLSKNIKEVYFRNKKNGWSVTMDIIFEDGTIYTKKSSGDDADPYLFAFLNNYMMRYICYDCKFNQYPRQGDFTIGDLWHSDKLDPDSNDKKGTSFVFVNNSKGKAIYEKIKDESKYNKLLSVENYSQIPNRVSPKTIPNANRKRFLELVDSKGFIDALEYCKKKKYDIGLVGVIGNENIGSVLTYYALYNYLTDIGYSVLLIERPLDSPLPVNEKAKAFTDKWIPSYAGPFQYESILDMSKLNEICNQFVVGSDQVYLASMSKARNDCYFLSWVDDYKNKVGYACSFGGPKARGDEFFYQEMAYYLNRFSFLSSRENDGVELINSKLKTDVKARWCIDPVFLCDKKHYLKLINATSVVRTQKYIGAYVVIPRPSIANLIKKTEEHFETLPVELVGNPKDLDNSNYLKKYKARDSFPIGRILETIYNSEFFVTDSFHGVCFAIIFRKDFLVIPRDFVDRFTSLLERIGLMDRILSPNLSDLDDSSYKKIDYDLVYKKLETLIEESKDSLINSLKQEKSEKFTDADVLNKKIRKQQSEIADLQKKIDELSKTHNTKEFDYDLFVKYMRRFVGDEKNEN